MNDEIKKPDPAVSAALDDLAAQIVEDPPASLSGTVETAPEVKAKEWREVTVYVVKFAAEFASNWTFSPLARQLLEEGTAECLDQIWPGGFANMENWGPYAKLLAGIGLVGMVNFDAKTKRLKPLQVTHDATPGRSVDGGGGPDTQRQDIKH
ncbi:MAG: hypothetical protein WBR15_10885 [Gammaproteobacteria bacterium]